MRLKHVKGAKEKVETSPYVIALEEKMKNPFENNHPIHLEIGMGKGDFIIEKAKRYPEINFIGVEKYDSVLVRAVEKVENLELPNLKFLLMDAVHIDAVFDHTIKELYLNFSDPWPKKRHQERRLMSPTFLKKYDRIFQKDATITMKTDNRKLFEYALTTFTEDGYQIKRVSLDLYQDDDKENIPTEYEKKFVEKKQVIYLVEVEKKK